MSNYKNILEELLDLQSQLDEAQEKLSSGTGFWGEHPDDLFKRDPEAYYRKKEALIKDSPYYVPPKDETNYGDNDWD